VLEGMPPGRPRTTRRPTTMGDTMRYVEPDEFDEFFYSEECAATNRELQDWMRRE